MKIISVFTFVIIYLISATLSAETYKGDGSWAVINYAEGTFLVIGFNVYREDPGKGAMPTFMINRDSNGCYVSFGLSMLKKDLPQSLSNKQSDVLLMLKKLVENSDLFADDELLAGGKGDVQALDIGPSLFARKLIDADTLAALMMAKSGMLKVKNRDAVIRFNMNGFEKTMNKVMDGYCD